MPATKQKQQCTSLLLTYQNCFTFSEAAHININAVKMQLHFGARMYFFQEGCSKTWYRLWNPRAKNFTLVIEFVHQRNNEIDSSDSNTLGFVSIQEYISWKAYYMEKFMEHSKINNHKIFPTNVLEKNSGKG